MRSLKNVIVKFIREEEGLTVVEYAVAGGLISLLVVGAFRALGLTVSGIIDRHQHGVDRRNNWMRVIQRANRRRMSLTASSVLRRRT